MKARLAQQMLQTVVYTYMRDTLVLQNMHASKLSLQASPLGKDGTGLLALSKRRLNIAAGRVRQDRGLGRGGSWELRGNSQSNIEEMSTLPQTKTHEHSAPGDRLETAEETARLQERHPTL